MAREVAARLGLPFFDADDFHSAGNVAKMRDGTPLDDADRSEWLDALARLIEDREGMVLACSALKRSYRDRLRAADPDIAFLYLAGDYDTIRARMSARNGHYFGGDAMLRSQFETLEAPPVTEAARIDVAQEPEAVVAACLAHLQDLRSRPRGAGLSS